MQSVLSKGREITLNPYPHVMIEDALPWDLYNALSREFPEELLLERIEGENKRGDVHARERSLLSPLWQEFIVHHTTDYFWRYEVLRLFGDAIRLIYYGIDSAERLEEWSVGVRGETQGDINLDCQPGINTPQGSAGRVRGPHLDNPIELYAGMLYMGEGEGDLEIGRLVKPPKWHGKLEIEDECVEVVGTVKYKPNNFVMFLNSPTSIHAVTPRQSTSICRRMCNIIGEANQPLFEVGHGRY